MTQLGAKLCLFQVIKMIMMMMMTMVMMMIDYTKAETRKLLRKSDHTVAVSYTHLTLPTKRIV